MQSESTHVLIVEDDEVTRAKLAGYLEAAGHRVSEASNGSELREIMANQAVDLVSHDLAQLVVVGLELGELSLEIARIPKEHVIQILSAARADEPFHERMGEWHVGYGLDLFDVDDVQVCLPAMILDRASVLPRPRIGSLLRGQSQLALVLLRCFPAFAEVAVPAHRPCGHFGPTNAE